MSEGINVTGVAGGSAEEAKKLEKDWEILQRIIIILKKMGFSTCDRFLTKKQWFEESWKNGIPFPVVDDGGNGIRVSVSKRQKLMVWFTNSFEEPENPRRQEVISKIVSAGLGDYVFKMGYKN